MNAETCRIKHNYSRAHAEKRLSSMLREYYRFLNVRKPVEQVRDDAHHALLDISEELNICFKGEW